jgi:hypothetical protein
MGKLPETEVTMGERKNQLLFGFPGARDQSRKRCPLTFVSAVLRFCCTFPGVYSPCLRHSEGFSIIVNPDSVRGP